MARIVVIDDRVTNRNIVTRLALSVEEGLQVNAYASPIEALDAFDAGLTVDLIVTDYNMPEMDGATFVRSLRRRAELAEVPVMVVTVYEDREFCYRALEAGATDFLLSPVDHLEFRARARNLLTLRRQQNLLAERAADLEQALSRQASGNGDPLLQAVLDAVPAAISIVDTQGRMVFANRTHEEITGINRADSTGRAIGETHSDDYAVKHAVLDEKVRESGMAIVRPRYVTFGTGDDQRCLLTSKALLADDAGWGRQVVTVAMDVTEMRRDEAASLHAMQHDAVTGLGNAEMFRERLELALGLARRDHQILALHHLDLDRFKGINDAFGDEFGDQLLGAVATRLHERLGVDDLIARLPSDEFVVLQAGVQRPDEAAELCRKLAEAFSEPYLIRDREVHLSVSIGVTLSPADGRGSDALMKNAELAMYRAKASGRDTFRFFAAEMNLQARKAVTLERELRQALAAEQFLVYYQPQMDLVSGEIVGVEALVRWNHPRRGIVRPGEFIALAEDLGLIAPLTAWVLRSACRQHRLWLDRGLERLQLSVNLSPVQFRERGVEWMIERVLRETGVPPACLDVELTENTVIENSQSAMQSLRYLNQLGVTLSIDDFGTGYSSLSYIKRLPVHRLKIDQSFVQNLESSVNDEVIVRAIINLGHSLGLKVIAEGVETEGQLARLRRLACDEVQGHLISQPVEAAALEARLFGQVAEAPAGG